MRESGDVLNRIREGAIAAVARHGLRKLSMADVGAEAGVSRGTLYRYFTNRADLLDALADYVQELLERAVADAVTANPSLDDRVRVVVGAVTDFGRRPEFRHLLDREPVLVRDFVTERFDQLVGAVAKALAPAVGDDRSGLPMIDPWSVAEILMRLSLSYAEVRPPDGFRSAESLDQVVDRLLGRKDHREIGPDEWPRLASVDESALRSHSRRTIADH